MQQDGPCWEPDCQIELGWETQYQHHEANQQSDEFMGRVLPCAPWHRCDNQVVHVTGQMRASSQGDGYKHTSWRCLLVLRHICARRATD